MKTGIIILVFIFTLSNLYAEEPEEPIDAKIDRFVKIEVKEKKEIELKKGTYFLFPFSTGECVRNSMIEVKSERGSIQINSPGTYLLYKVLDKTLDNY